MKRLISAATVAALALFAFAPIAAPAQYANNGVAQHYCSTLIGGSIPSWCATPGGDQPFAYDAGATKTLTQVIAAPTAGSIRIPVGAGFVYGEESATGGTLELEQGTGSNCASNASIIFAVALPASGIVAYTLPAIIVKAKYELCFFVSAGTLVDGGVFGTFSTY